MRLGTDSNPTFHPRSIDKVGGKKIRDTYHVYYTASQEL